MKSVITILALVSASAFAGQTVDRAGAANGHSCSVSLRVEDNGFVSGASIAGVATLQRVGSETKLVRASMDLMDAVRFASMRFFQSPMLVDVGTTLYSYYDTSLVTAEETKFEIFGDLRNPSAVRIYTSHLEGPIVKGHVSTTTWTCSNLK